MNTNRVPRTLSLLILATATVSAPRISNAANPTSPEAQAFRTAASPSCLRDPSVETCCARPNLVLVEGTSEDDQFVFDDRVSRCIVTYEGSDLVVSGSGEDIVVLGADDDLFLGQNTTKLVYGGTGRDIILGSTGGAEMRGQDGSDVVIGNFGDDLIYGGLATDVLIGGDGADEIDGGPGLDLILGGAGPDIIVGGVGDDLIGGETADDLIFPGPGDDFVLAGEGDDTVALCSLDETSGSEILGGGPGRDTFLAGATAQEVLATGVIAPNFEVFAQIRHPMCDGKPVTWSPVEPGSTDPSLPGGAPETKPGDTCIPDEQYDSASPTLLSPRTGPGCTTPIKYCRVDIVNGLETWTEITEQEAIDANQACEAFDTTYCPRLSDGTLPDYCDSAPFDADCVQFEVCPDPLDVPQTPDETADPDPTFDPGIKDVVLPPGTGSPEQLILLQEITAYVPPCFWETAQGQADRWFEGVPETTKPNFRGLGDGATCQVDFECESNNCDTALSNTCLPAVTSPAAPVQTSWDKGNNRWNVSGSASVDRAYVHAGGIFYPSVAWEAGAEAKFDADFTLFGVESELLSIRTDSGFAPTQPSDLLISAA